MKDVLKSDIYFIYLIQFFVRAEKAHKYLKYSTWYTGGGIICIQCKDNTFHFKTEFIFFFKVHLNHEH